MHEKKDWLVWRTEGGVAAETTVSTRPLPLLPDQAGRRHGPSLPSVRPGLQGWDRQVGPGQK